MKIIWLCNYSVDQLQQHLGLNFKKLVSHPATWLTYLKEEIQSRSELNLHIITISQLVNKDSIFQDGGTYFYVLDPALGIRNKILRKVVLRLQFIFNYVLLKHKIIKLIKSINPDIINIHGTENFYGTFIKNVKFPVLIWMQGLMHNVIKYDTKKHIKKFLVNERNVFKKYKYFVTLPSNLENIISKYSKNPHFYHLNYPISKYAFELFDDNVDKKYDMIFVGGLVKRKGIEDFIDCVKIVKDSFPKVRAAIVGLSWDKEYEKFLFEKIKNYHIEESIDFLGYLPNHKDVLLKIKESNMLILPTYVDTGPRVVAESMAIGTPVISYNVDGLPAMVTNESDGFLVSVGDVKALALCCMQLLNNEELRMKISVEANKTALKNFSVNSIVPKLIDVYKEIIELYKREIKI